MMKKVLTIFLCLASLSAALKIEAHTTAGCSDTVNWIQNQLLPTYREFSEYLEVQFVPWGKTIRGFFGDLICQFGEADCWANRLQGCVTDLLRLYPDKIVEYMGCEFTEGSGFLQRSYSCALAHETNLMRLDFCMMTGYGDAIERQSEYYAERVMPIVNFVPAIVVDDEEPNAANSTAAFRNLREVVCQRLIADPNVPITSC